MPSGGPCGVVAHMGELLVLACGLFEGERPQLVEEGMKMGASSGTTSGFGRGVSACVAGNPVKVAELSSKLDNTLLCRSLPLGGIVTARKRLEAEE